MILIIPHDAPTKLAQNHQSLGARNGGWLLRVAGRKGHQLCRPRIVALLYAVAVAADQQQCESDDCYNPHWLPFPSTTTKSLRLDADGDLTQRAKAARERLFLRYNQSPLALALWAGSWIELPTVCAVLDPRWGRPHLRTMRTSAISNNSIEEIVTARKSCLAI
jgi:hypothetical protein